MRPLKRGRELPDEVLALIAHVVKPLGANAAILEQQATRATYVKWSSTMLDVEVPDNVPRVSLEDGPTGGSAVVYDDLGQPIGEILVWIRSGVLLGLEQAWFTDEPPMFWPPPSNVRVE